MANSDVAYKSPENVIFAILGYICDMMEEKASAFIVKGHSPSLNIGRYCYCLDTL